jgi:hypothetical protein
MGKAAKGEYGLGTLYEKRGAWYGRWRTPGGLKRSRKIAAVKGTGGLGLSRTEARRELQRMIERARAVLRCTGLCGGSSGREPRRGITPDETRAVLGRQRRRAPFEDPFWRCVVTWVVLFIAGLFETAWALALKESHGFSKLVGAITVSSSVLITEIPHLGRA